MTTLLREERGLTTTELAFLAPLLLFVIVGIAQAALWAHANSAAQAAADFGAEVASAYDATPRQGQDAAAEFLDQIGNVNNINVEPITFSADGTRLTIVVTGDVPGVVGSLSVRAVSTAVVERGLTGPSGP